MGNCSLKAVADGECSNNIKLVTESEGIIELKAPKLAKDILNLYPGYGIFRTEHGSCPLGSHEYLINGQFYYLLPLQELPLSCDGEAVIRREGLEVLPWEGNGVWKVKLVISSQELEEILSEERNTEALIEKMRMAAASFAPARRRRSFWGGVGSLPGIFNVFKVSLIDVPR